MNIRNLSRGTVVAGLTVLALLATTFGKPQLAAFIGDPTTADALQAVIVGTGTIVSGVLEGIKKDA